MEYHKRKFSAFCGKEDFDEAYALVGRWRDRNEAFREELQELVSSQKSGADPLLNPGQKRPDESSLVDLPKILRRYRNWTPPIPNMQG